jgi:hypothetical protein
MLPHPFEQGLARQGGSVIVLENPLGRLRMPDEGVPDDLYSVHLAEVGKAVRVRKVVEARQDEWPHFSAFSAGPS